MRNTKPEKQIPLNDDDDDGFACFFGTNNIKCDFSN